ncbi:hypothetical protein BD324DRAFT_628997 [Kockovaella imperatae]|uniref:Uncharacterized protein n=1 Tax=Kockovaella imperatae TaxID=4999 RepID=A0A1Y1UG20_9TREE|nr:hypothetical protein BD324DRAFT_628997 [Kockovaella imperatae]ORX36477.1 hypothetical protein BD324DRAFT_628997 [Kockovaella imperatae]
MPHKRAKRSVREAEVAKKGFNLAPKSSSAVDDAPKSASRILNSWAVQSSFRASGRKTSEDTGERKGKKRKVTDGKTDEARTTKSQKPIKASKSNQNPGDDSNKVNMAGPSVPRIMPHETLGDYNRRVESLLRPGVSKAIKAAQQRQGKAAKGSKGKEKEGDHPTMQARGGEVEEKDNAAGPGQKQRKRKQEFDVAPVRKRVNDIAQAPPTLLHLKKGPDRPSSVWGAKGLGKSGLSAGQERILAEERERVVKRYREMKAQREAAKDSAGEVRSYKAGATDRLSD